MNRRITKRTRSRKQQPLVDWREILLFLSFSLLGSGAVSPLLAAPPLKPTATLADCMTYSPTEGDGYFALSLQLETEAIDDRPREVAILFDTSASQIGLFREKALGVLEHLLETLPPTDRVMLWGVDLRAKLFTKDWVAPQSPEMRQALEDLNDRAPLGATDLEQVFSDILPKLPAGQGFPRAIIYIGDGMSRAALVRPEDLIKRIDKLVLARLPVSAYLTGPSWDAQLMATIVNHTGGQIAIENNQRTAKEYGAFLAEAAHGTVYWPESVQLPAGVIEIFPNPAPPLRSDRDSILVGRGRLQPDAQISMLVKESGQPHQVRWKIQVRPSDEVNGYLSEVFAAAEKWKGKLLPLVGAAGLAEAKRALNVEFQEILELASFALSNGNPEDAEPLAKKALEIDPESSEAKILLKEVAKEYLGLARAAMNAKNYIVAAEYVRRATNLDPDVEGAGVLQAMIQNLAQQAGMETIPPPSQDLTIKEEKPKDQTAEETEEPEKKTSSPEAKPAE
ncbi:Hypothetical protein PBC10988_28140 [Planctomycetales bacterium 10988]|nr:Hypothetical protein PBC10988_28140 [Planctomycetales bacterium 10988]